MAQANASRRKPRPRIDPQPQASTATQGSPVPFGIVISDVFADGDTASLILLLNGPYDPTHFNLVTWAVADDQNNTMPVLEARPMTVFGSTQQNQLQAIEIFYTSNGSKPFRLTPSQTGKVVGDTTAIGIPASTPIYPFCCETAF